MVAGDATSKALLSRIQLDGVAVRHVRLRAGDDAPWQSLVDAVGRDARGVVVLATLGALDEEPDTALLQGLNLGREMRQRLGWHVILQLHLSRRLEGVRSLAPDLWAHRTGLLWMVGEQDFGPVSVEGAGYWQKLEDALQQPWARSELYQAVDRVAWQRLEDPRVRLHIRLCAHTSKLDLIQYAVARFGPLALNAVLTASDGVPRIADEQTFAAMRNSVSGRVHLQPEAVASLRNVEPSTLEPRNRVALLVNEGERLVDRERARLASDVLARLHPSRDAFALACQNVLGATTSFLMAAPLDDVLMHLMTSQEAARTIQLGGLTRRLTSMTEQVLIRAGLRDPSITVKDASGGLHEMLEYVHARRLPRSAAALLGDLGPEPGRLAPRTQALFHLLLAQAYRREDAPDAARQQLDAVDAVPREVPVVPSDHDMDDIRADAEDPFLAAVAVLWEGVKDPTLPVPLQELRLDPAADLRPEADRVRAGLLMAEGRCAEALDLLDGVRAAYQGVPWPSRVGETLSERARVLLAQGRPEEALLAVKAGEAALEAERSEEVDVRPLPVQLTLGFDRRDALLALGRPREAKEVLQDLIGEVTRAGARVRLPEIYMALASLAGEPLEDRLQAARKALALTREMRLMLDEGHALAVLARVLHEAGRGDEARATWSSACWIADRIQDEDLRRAVDGADPGL